MMASFNTVSKGRMKTTNKSGHAAYKLDDKTLLVTMALTTMLGEKKFYGDNTADIRRLAERLCRDGEGEFVAKLAVWARTKGNLRSVSHMLIAIVAHECSGQPFVRPSSRVIASRRGDDGTEMLAAYKAMYGNGWPHAMQRGIRDALEGMSPCSIAKYQSKGRDMKMRDTLRITHPKPSDTALSEAMGKCVAGELPMPKGWETELSERGNTKEVWDELLSERKVGIFAATRNLRNMVRAGADVSPVIEMLENEETIRNSRMLPFRFYSAYSELDNAGLLTTRMSRALDRAMCASCENVDGLRGRTAVLIDVSGSMSSRVSANSMVSCVNIAAVLGAMVAHVADDAYVCAFDNHAKVVPMGGTSVLSDVRMVPYASGGTNMKAGFDLLSKSGFDADRVVVLSDNEVNHGWGTDNRKTIQSCLEAYRKKVGHDVWCHAIDLQGYGTSQFIGHKVNVMAGWSDAVLDFIGKAERGFDTIVSEIDSIVF